MFAPERADATLPFLDWMRERESKLFVSAITVAEIEQGIAKLQRLGSIRRVAAISGWLEGTLERFGDRLLPMDARVARAAGQIADATIAAGRHPGYPDVYIAATAKVHDLLLLTRNMRHFQPLGIAIADPLAALPD